MVRLFLGERRGEPCKKNRPMMIVTETGEDQAVSYVKAQDPTDTNVTDSSCNAPVSMLQL